MRLAYKIAELAWAAGCAEGGLLAQSRAANTGDAIWKELQSAKAELTALRLQAKLAKPAPSPACGSGAAMPPARESRPMRLDIVPAALAADGAVVIKPIAHTQPPRLSLRYRYYAWLIDWWPSHHQPHRHRTLWRVLFPAAP